MTISGESMQIENGIAKIETTINLRAEVFEYLDQCFQLIGLTWTDFFQEQIEEAIDGIKEQSSSWLGDQIQTKLKEI